MLLSDDAWSRDKSHRVSGMQGPAHPTDSMWDAGCGTAAVAPHPSDEVMGGSNCTHMPHSLPL